MEGEGPGRCHMAAGIGILEEEGALIQGKIEQKFLELMIIIQNIFFSFYLRTFLLNFDTDHSCLRSAQG